MVAAASGRWEKIRFRSSISHTSSHSAYERGEILDPARNPGRKNPSGLTKAGSAAPVQHQKWEGIL